MHNKKHFLLNLWKNHEGEAAAAGAAAHPSRPPLQSEQSRIRRQRNGIQLLFVAREPQSHVSLSGKGSCWCSPR